MLQQYNMITRYKGLDNLDNKQQIYYLFISEGRYSYKLYRDTIPIEQVIDIDTNRKAYLVKCSYKISTELSTSIFWECVLNKWLSVGNGSVFYTTDINKLEEVIRQKNREIYSGIEKTQKDLEKFNSAN